MARVKKMMVASDGTIFEYKNAADRYERGQKLGKAIDKMDISKSAKDFLKENWTEIRRIELNAAGAFPYEQVEDSHKIVSNHTK